MQRLSGMDASFVYGETPSWHMHAGALVVLDPSTAPHGFDVVRLRSLFEARAGSLGPFLRRLVEVPFGLDRPAWVDDPHLDLDRHVRRVGVPTPGGPRELGALVGDLFAFKLERDRPLWEVWFIEGLEERRVALLVKVHHALVDGARGARLYELLFDATPDAPLERPGTPEVRSERIPSEWEMALRALPRLAGTPLRAARAICQLGPSALGMLRFHNTPEWPGATFPFQAPRTSLNQTITAHRGFAFCSVPFAGVKAIKDAFSVTVNDVVLGICAGALRRYLADRGELPAKPLIAQIPIAVHVDDGGGPSAGVWGNAVAVMGAALATQLDDPADRLRAIHASTSRAKVMHEALGGDLILDLAEVAPPGILAAGVRAYSRFHLSEHHPPIFNLIISNVRGPPIALYVAGARLVANYPIGPLLDGGGLNVTVISYLDHIDFGFAVCSEIVQDPWLLVDATAAAFAELKEAATRSASPPKNNQDNGVRRAADGACP
ncbi:MAG: WS/DGAT/MGAT family O-acyltransferase [Acidimicrobiales bacterium]